MDKILDAINRTKEDRKKDINTIVKDVANMSATEALKLLQGESIEKVICHELKVDTTAGKLIITVDLVKMLTSGMRLSGSGSGNLVYTVNANIGQGINFTGNFIRKMK